MKLLISYNLSNNYYYIVLYKHIKHIKQSMKMEWQKYILCVWNYIKCKI